jgi:solute carrier family 25 (mitochondrial citrate transporter), member 1
MSAAPSTPAKKKSNPLTAMTAGCIAGGIEATAVWPMEYIKTQLQLHSKVKVGSASPLPYTGMLSGLQYTVRTTGFWSLYRGLAPTLLGSIPKAGIRFGLNSVFKEMMRGKDGKLNPGQNFLAGMGAGISEALLIVAPVETVKTKCIELNMGFLSGLKQIIKNEGISGVYQGAFATALKQGSNQGLRFMWFNEFQRIVTNDGETKMTPILGLLGGMSAGCFSTLGNNPFDVVKVSTDIFTNLSAR